jgi:hypothetical protein
MTLIKKAIWLLEKGETAEYLATQPINEKGLRDPKKIKKDGQVWFKYPVSRELLETVCFFDRRLDVASGLIDVYQAKVFEHKKLILAFEARNLILLDWTTYDGFTEYRLGDFLNRVAADFCHIPE